MSTYLIIEELYKLRKITMESHEEYLKYNRQSNKTYSKQLEIIDKIILNINKIYDL